MALRCPIYGINCISSSVKTALQPPRVASFIGSAGVRRLPSKATRSRCSWASAPLAAQALCRGNFVAVTCRSNPADCLCWFEGDQRLLPRRRAAGADRHLRRRRVRGDLPRAHRTGVSKVYCCCTSKFSVDYTTVCVAQSLRVCSTPAQIRGQSMTRLKMWDSSRHQQLRASCYFKVVGADVLDAYSGRAHWLITCSGAAMPCHAYSCVRMLSCSSGAAR